MDGWTKIVVLFLWSGPFLGKLCAYTGLAIGPLLFLDPRILLRRWYHALTRSGDPLSGFAWALFCSLTYGIAEVVYGVLSGNPLVTALQILIFNICPLYLFLGIWAGMRRPDIVRQFIRYQAWFVVVYTPLYILVFSKLHISLAGVDLFGSPGSGSGTLLGLFAYEKNLAPFWLPIFLLSGLTIAAQERADWLGFGVALIIWGAATKKLGRVFAMAGMLAGLLLIGFWSDFKLPPIPGRGGEISARETVSRALGAISPTLAEDVGSTSVANAKFYYGTVYWRKVWWQGIRDEVSKNYHTLLFGLGYGYPIKDLGGAEERKGDIRSPHSIFYFALSYSGCLGVLLFFWLQTCILLLLWKTYKATGQIFGLAWYSALLLGSFFGNFLETPQAGITTYVVVGLCAGTLCHRVAAGREKAARLIVTHPRRGSGPIENLPRLSLTGFARPVRRGGVRRMNSVRAPWPNRTA